jgi:molybdate transport system substrate-binding protein
MRNHLVLSFIFGLVLTAHVAADDIHVGAASSLIHVLNEIADQFEAETNHTIKLSFSSSGNLARQIMQGAPFEIFMSADENYVSFIQQNQLADDAGNVYGIGHLVLFIPEGSEVLSSPDLSTLISGTQNGQLKRLAIANPEYAPYGMIAKQALQNARVWDTVFSSLVYGKSASQAVQFGLTGAVDAALIPYPLALMPMVTNKGNFTLVSDSLYSPLKQRMVLLKNAGGAAREFYRFILGNKAREIFKRYGFGLSTTLNYQTASQES